MAESTEHCEASLLSKGLYRKVSDVIGPECLVKLRRLQWDMHDVFANSDSSLLETMKTSGSMSEGFQFETSDYDSIYIDRRAKVLTGLCQLPVLDTNISSLFLMETDNVSPGYALLRCLKCDHNNSNIFKSLVWRNGKIYVNSKHVRETFLSARGSVTHGPCQTIRTLVAEADFSYALRCPTWPMDAISFVTRSLDRKWPTHAVLTDICQDGCLFVPVNSKQQHYIDMIDLEWRISFSLAEKKLIYSMNHCQFLCYGLSKLFLNEILKNILPQEDLLCSYFMKTAIFWEIHEDSNGWSVYNFFPKFWNVFRRLLKWVSVGYCPNFFILTNNMFRGKIFGENQSILMAALRDLHLEGYQSLLRCPSLNEVLSIIIARPYAASILPCDEKEYVPVANFEKRKLKAILQFDAYVPAVNVNRIMAIMKSTAMLNIDSEEMRHALRLRANYILQKYAETLLLSTETPSQRSSSRNGIRYKNIKAAHFILQRRKTFFCSNYLIYAKCLYIAGNYNKAIEILQSAKQKFQSKTFMYESNPNTGVIMEALGQGMSFVTLTKKFIACDIEIDLFTAMEELQLECRVKQQNIGTPGLLLISPIVFSNFLLVLCYTRNGDYRRRFEILTELHELINNNDGNDISLVSKAMYWEILGICHQLCGNHHCAYHSYIRALQERMNNFKEATILRINSLWNDI